MTLTAAMVAPAVLATPQAVGALDACNGNWTPVLRDVTINQGLGTYSPLARGKTTLVRLFLSSPACAPAGSEQLTAAALTATDGAQTLASGIATTPAKLGPVYPTIDSYVSAPTNNGAANPIFEIPGFGSSDTSPGVFTATFSATINYQYQSVLGGPPSTATATVALSPSGSPITASVAPAPHPLRVLVVPMGDASDSNRCREFPEARYGCTPTNGQFADTGVQNGMTTLSRLYPVADGVGDLTSTTAGLRYRLDDAAMIDLGPNGLGAMGSAAGGARFCGTGSNFSFPPANQPATNPTIESQLAAFLNNWNSARGNPPADRIVGVVWQGISQGTANGCAEGYANIGGTVTFARDFVDQTVTGTNSLGQSTTTPDPSETGALFGMELAHTWNSVPANDPRSIGAHSKNSQADPAGSNRAYNLTEARWLQNPPSVMQYTGDSTGYTQPSGGGVSGWNNNTALLEKEDYAFDQCALTPGLSSTNCPYTGGAMGAVGSAGAAPADFTLSGTTDGTVGGTNIHSYFANAGLATAQDPSSKYHLIERDSHGNIINSCGTNPPPGCVNDGDQLVPIALVDSDHAGTTGVLITPTEGTIDATLPADQFATSFELWNGEPPPGSSACTPTNMPAGCLYTRAVGVTPIVTPLSGPAQLTNVQDFTNAVGDETRPALSSDGRFVAWVTASGIVVQGRNASTNRPTGTASAALSGSDPNWSADGSHLVYATSAGDIDTVTVNTAVNPPAFGSPQVVYNHLLQTPPPLGSTSASHPSFSPDGASLAAAINGDIWKFAASSSAANPVVCDLAALSATSTCQPLTQDSTATRVGSNSAPSWGRSGGTNSGGSIAYDHGPDLWTLDPGQPGAGYGRTLRVAGASAPAWGGPLVGYTQSGNISVADSSVIASDGTWTSRTTLTSGGTDAAPSLSADGTALALDRSVGGSNGRDIFDGTISTQGANIQFTAKTTDDPRTLTADLALMCAGTYEPIGAEVRPTSTVTGSPYNTATFSYPYDTRLGCPGGSAYAQVTNGFSRSPLTLVFTIPTPPPGSPAPVPNPAIASPTTGSTYLQYDAIQVAGSTVDPSSGTNGGSVQTAWYLTGPQGSGYSNTLVSTSVSFELDPPSRASGGGWTPGSYTLEERATNTATGQSSSASTSYAVLPDPNHSGVNIAVSFSPQSLYVPSSGNDVTLNVTSQGQSLSSIDPSTVHISRVGSYAVWIPIDTASGTTGWAANGDGTYSAKFNRQTLSCVLMQKQLIGFYVAVVLTASGPGGLAVTGFDPSYPVTSPSSSTTTC